VAQVFHNNPVVAGAINSIRGMISGPGNSQPDTDSVNMAVDAVIALSKTTDGARLLGDCGINNLSTMDNLRAAAALTAHGTQQAVSLRTNMTALASVFTGSSHQDTMSLSLPLVKEWSTNIKTFVHHRMTLLDAISAGSASFDILCRPGVYTLYIASMTNKVPFHPMSGSHEVTNVFNNKYGDDPDGTNMHFKSIFPPAGISSLGIDFTLSHLSSSLSTLDAVRSAVHGTAHHAPKLKIIFELTCQAASDFYDALYHDFPGILNKEHFQFTLFHWLFMRWAQRIQAPYSFSATDIQPFAAMLKNPSAFHPIVSDAMKAFAAPSKRRAPDASPTQHPTGGEADPATKKMKGDRPDRPSFKDVIHMVSNSTWHKNCYNFSTGMPCRHAKPGKPCRHHHICAVCGQEDKPAFTHCKEAFAAAKGMAKQSE
jgi:hypothetical protein